MLLYRTHRNYLVALVVLLTFNMASACANFFASDRFFASNRGLEYVNKIDPTVWGILFGTAAVLLAVGIWRTNTFPVARIGLAIGLMTCMTRFILLGFNFDLTITGLPTWYCVAGMHLSCALEPPYNPATSS